MADTVMRGVLEALKNKIRAASDPTAETTAEDLAMLGTALEKIAGRVSAVELELLAEDLQADFEALAASRTTGFDTNASAKMKTLNDTATARTTSVNNTGTTNVEKVAAEGVKQIAFVQGAGLGAIATPEINDTTVDIDSFGRVTRWANGTGQTFSEIKYDRLDRIISWTETVPKAGGGTTGYHYPAVYKTTSPLPTLTRAAI